MTKALILLNPNLSGKEIGVLKQEIMSKDKKHKCFFIKANLLAKIEKFKKKNPKAIVIN